MGNGVVRKTKMSKSTVAFVILCLQIILSMKMVAASTNETDSIKSVEEGIYNQIFANYNKYIIATNVGRRTNVLFDISLQTINRLDVKTQVIKLTTFTQMRWTDLRLRWNLSEHSDENYLNVDNSLVWTPDVMLYNDASEEPKAHLELYRSKVMIKNDGDIKWIMPVVYVATCSVDVTWFPVDKQICNLTFGSWSFHANKLQLHFKNKKKSSDTIKAAYHHVPSGQWQLDNLGLYEEDLTFDCCDRPFSTITLSLTLVRYSSYYYLYIFLPFLSQLFLFLLVFHIKPHHGDRLSYGVALLLNMTMYMIFLSDKLPEKSDNSPFIGYLFVIYLFTLSFALSLSSLTMWYAENTTPIPKLANKLKKWLDSIGKKFKCCCNRVAVNRRSFRMQQINQSADNDHLAVVDKNVNVDDSTNTRHHSIDSEDGHDGFRTWIDYMNFVDKFLFYLFIFLLIIEPMIIAACLSGDYKGGTAQ